MLRARYILSTLAVLALTLGVVIAYKPLSAVALSGSDFNAGRIIDDGRFFDPGAMTVDQIQNFLNAKIPSCDTNGTKASTHWNSSAGRYYTRAEWGSLNGNPAPFICLKDYRQDVPNKSSDAYCKGGITGGNKSAAQIISEVSQACSVSPQVLLVLLQKEQGLPTDEWPWQKQYTAATGFGCPDTASCDPAYAGYFNQVYAAARQYQKYATQPQNYKYPTYSSSYVLYNPSTSCGGTNVYIQSQATSGLYNYTPYQPNQAALNNLYGTGDNCSAYGNRNFWRLFSDWFGSTQLFNANIVLSQGLTSSVSGGNYVGSTVTASFTVSNTGDYDILAGGLGICARMNGEYYDFGFSDQNSIPAKSSKTFTFSKTIDRAGSLNIFTCSYHASIGGWASSFYPYSTASNQTRTANLNFTDNPLITTGISTSPANPAIGQPVTATMSIRNASSNPVNIGMAVVAARDPNGNNVDFPADSNVTIPANTTYTYSQTRTFSTPGNYSFFVADLHNGTWDMNYPKSADTSVNRQSNVTVTDNPLITTGISTSPANPAIGQPVTATMSIRNASSNPVNIGMAVVAARDPNGNNVDFPADSNVTIPANTTYTYSQTRTFSTPGNYSFFVADLHNGTWDMNYPKSANASIVRQLKVGVADNPLLISSLTLNPAAPATGQSTTATIQIRNASNASVNLGLFVIAGRDPHGNNVDFPGVNNLTIPANTTYTYSQTRTFSTPGNYSFFVADLHNGTWDMNYPKSADTSVLRQITAGVH